MRAVTLFACGALLLRAPLASAYCRAGVDSSSDPCIETAAPRLFWPRSCVSYVFHDQAFARLPLLSETQTRTIAERSFQTWAEVDCGREPFSVQQLAGTTSTPKPIWFFSNKPNEFVLSALTAAEWAEREESARIFAITFIWHHPDTGEIYDVDLALNLGIGDFGDCDIVSCSDGVVDLQNTLTHEAGHVLGLGHTSPFHPGATMIADAQAGDTFMRTLTDDDRAGLCALDLPPHECATPQECVCPAPAALSTATSSTSCVLTPHEHGPASSGVTLLLAPALLWLRRRRLLSRP